MGTGAAILGASALAAGASIWGASETSKAAGKAAQAQVAGADRATAAQLEMYYQGREDLAPWREAGQNALAKLTGVMETGPGEFVPEDQPGYKFGFEEFIRKPQGQAASAAGQRLSGQSMRDLTKYASDYASTGYDNFLNRYYSSLSPYQSLSGAGQSSAAGQAQLGAQTGRGVAQTQMASGAAQAGGIMGQANALAGGIAGVAGAGTNALQNYMDFKILDKIGVGGTGLTPAQQGIPNVMTIR